MPIRNSINIHLYIITRILLENFIGKRTWIKRNLIYTFDLIVIGTGTAASTIASECISAGWSVAIIDSLSFGGTCALRGCDPKKILVEAAKIIDSNQRHENKGIIGSVQLESILNSLI